MNKLLLILMALLLTLSPGAFAKEKNFPDLLLVDDFADGDYTDNPSWEVPRGVFSVVDNKLVSRVQGGAKKQQNTGTETDDTSFEDYSWEELTSGFSDSTSSDDGPALIYTNTTLSNAFSLRLDHEFVGGTGKMVLGIYQVKRGKLGYRVVIDPQKIVRLIRLGETQGRVVVAKSPLNMNSDKPTRIVWSRFKNGRHVIRIGGEKMLDVVDPYFKEPFDGFFILNRKGEQRIDRVAARGGR